MARRRAVRVSVQERRIAAVAEELSATRTVVASEKRAKRTNPSAQTTTGKIRPTKMNCTVAGS
ncbi:hypothetical protein [Streptomyces sp. NPDC059916]|uniref:hypothetical protein n=1 Tax=Streptomyces sp. NPDC059916 TaxID=3347001 RepID=UPI003676A43E